MSAQTRIVIIVGSIVAVLLAAAIVVGIVLVTTMNKQSSDDAYRACMATQGYSAGTQPPAGTSIEDMARAAEWCSKN